MRRPRGWARRAPQAGGSLAESIYKVIFDSAPVALLLTDDRRRYVDANPAACQLLGLSRARLLDMRIDDVLARAQSSVCVESAWSAFLRDGHQAATLDLVRPDGSLRSVSMTAQAHVLPGLHLAVLLDVSSQRAEDLRAHADRELLHAATQESRERVVRLQTVTAALARARTMVEVAQVICNEGCAAFEAERGIVSVVVEAGTALEIVSVHGAEQERAAPGMRFPLDVCGPMTDAVRTREPQIFSTREALRASHPALFEQYWSRYGALLALPLSLHQQALGALALAYASEREFSEADRRELAEFARLCAWAIERARLFDVAQTERRHAEEANRVKDEFLAVVSHELRTPLHAMLGWATLARSGKLGAEGMARALSTIERNAHAQAKLVEDLLDVTRITSGKLRVNLEPTYLPKVLEAALDVVRPAADAKGVRLELGLTSVHGYIASDPDRLQQILWNLLSNGVKFTDRGGSVRVQLSEDDSAVQVTIEDTGRGIEPSFLPHIYERFRQAETRKRGRLGLGLGLAIVKHLVELHGGTIEARSEGLGHGASFTVSFPRHRSDKLEPSVPSVQEITSDLTYPSQLRGLRALVVDDELESRELLASLFASCQMQARLASSAAEGFKLLQQEVPDVIVSDISMPDEDGYSFIERVRRLPKQSGGMVPAVALTANARWEDRTRALLAGYDMHVSKPVAPAELLVVVLNLSGRRKG
ncbi:MAG: two-component sensor histidine kinase [Myxococcaceae bacterium]|nr:two-component sensor histidine kinase [Myxococcaceae bacterium]